MKGITGMEKRLMRFLAYYEEAIGKAAAMSEAERKKLSEEMLVQIGFFQHERLVHLIVTVTFALLEIIALCTAVVYEKIIFAVLAVAILILLIPYVRHYYILENGVQRMYSQYDRISEKK